jgi:hypothetical protein
MIRGGWRPGPGRPGGRCRSRVAGATSDYDATVTDQPRTIDLRLELANDEELAELERALLRARATELSEVRRRDIRLAAGYGDATTRDVLDDEGRRASIRHDVLSRLLEALRAAGS